MGTCLARIETVLEYWKVMGVKGLGWGLNSRFLFVCLFVFVFEERALPQIQWNMLSVQSVCLLYSVLFSILEFSRAQELNYTLHSLLDFGPSLKSLLLCWWRAHHPVGCCWTEWVVSLFGLSCELYFFFFWSSVILPMITLCLLNRKWGVCQEGHSGSGEGGWGDYVS